jgi:hypothetical protein
MIAAEGAVDQVVQKQLRASDMIQQPGPLQFKPICARCSAVSAMAMAYRPAYALVANADKRVIVKINDVGLLEPGRVIDFNEQTMRYLIRLCSTG